MSLCGAVCALLYKARGYVLTLIVKAEESSEFGAFLFNSSFERDTTTVVCKYMFDGNLLTRIVHFGLCFTFMFTTK